MKRTQEEILKRFEESDDFFGTQKGDLIEFMEWENAKKYYISDYVEKVESGEIKREIPNPKDKILGYLDFAYEKAENQRGLSAGRSMLHFRTWIWLDDPEFYDEIIDDIDDYTDYGIPALDRISAHYGYTKENYES